jgi:hypothetical protein
MAGAAVAAVPPAGGAVGKMPVLCDGTDRPPPPPQPAMQATVKAHKAKLNTVLRKRVLRISFS